MKKLFFTFNLCLLIATFFFVSCGKRCLDPNANNSSKKGDCVYPADEFKGTYSMTCNCAPTTGAGTAISKSFEVEVLKIDNDNIAIKNLQGCGGSVNTTIPWQTYTAHFSPYTTVCDGVGYNIDGNISIVPSTGDLSFSYQMRPADLTLTWYNCTATGTRK